MELTYQQILAEQFQENDRLYRQEEDEDDVEEFHVEGHEAEDRGYEVEDRAAFREFAGNRNTEELIVNPKREFDDKGKASVRYNKDVIRRVFSIDTRFRAYLTRGFGQTVSGDPALTAEQNQAKQNETTTGTSSISHFVFRTHDIVKNGISVKLASMELPNRFCNLFQSRGNSSFLVKQNGLSDDYTLIEVDFIGRDPTRGGYYTNVSIVSEIEQKLNLAFQSVIDPVTNNYIPQFKCTRNTDGQAIIESIYPTGNPTRFDFSFPSEVVSPQLFRTLPQSLGFEETEYTNVTIIESEDAVDMNSDTYIYLQINDWNTVTPQVTNDAYFTVFAKIPVTVDKGKLIYDNDVTNTILKTYHFLQPTNVQQMEIRLLDRLGQVLQFPPNVNYSMTLEVEDVVSKALYEKLREM
jgi:hypothetical protein